jgi:hypothetical protein
LDIETRRATAGFFVVPDSGLFRIGVRKPATGDGTIGLQAVLLSG